MRGTHQGLRQHGQTSRIVPEIDHRWHFFDLTCNAASQTSGDGANHLPHCRPGGQQRQRVEILAGSGPKEAYLNAQDPVVQLYYRTHEGTHLRFLQSRSIGALHHRVCSRLGTRVNRTTD